MKTFTLLALTAALGASAALLATQTVTAGTLRAQDDTQDTARGAVKSVDSARKSFVITSSGEEARDITVTTNDSTVFMKDGKVAKMDEVVQVGNMVTVTHRKGSASKVETFATP